MRMQMQPFFDCLIASWNQLHSLLYVVNPTDLYIYHYLLIFVDCSYNYT